MKLNFSAKHVFITGGSSGIGLALANLLASQGADIAIMARRNHQLHLAADEIRSHFVNPAQQLRLVAGDVSDLEKVMPALAKYEQEHGTPDFLINSAGITYPGKFSTLAPEIFRDLVNINYLGTVYVTRAFVNGMLKRGSGWIVNISSMAGFIGTYGYSGYGASKYAVRGFSDVLRAELKPRGVQVSVVFPPDTLTPQLAFEKDLKPAITKELADNAGVLTAEKVASVIVKDMRKGRYTILPGFQSWFYYTLTSILGDFTYVVMDMEVKNAIRRIMKRRQ
ncbi:MAG: short-chain dehydrogenase [Anaerolinea sp.]|nr:short-chain dehydrogenase [Anaerolinea sp.]